MKKIIVLIAAMFITLTGAVVHAETATLGSDADTYLRDATVRGDGTFIEVRGGTYDFVSYLRFDTSVLGNIVISDAQLVMVNSGGATANGVINTARLALHGLNNVAGNTPQDWDEATFSETGTNPAGAEWANVAPINLTGGRLTNLDVEDGVAVTESIVKDAALDYWVAGAYTITISGAALNDFLQTRVYDGGLVTFVIANDDGNNNGGYGICSKEHATEIWRPKLVLTYSVITKAFLPVPADKAVVPAYTSQVSWRNPDPNDPLMPEITSDVYLGIDPNNMALIADDTLLETAAIPFALSAPAKYYWRVDCTDPNSGLIVGNLWSFDTSAAPEVAANPADTTGFDSAVFTADFISTSTVISNKWYKVGEPAVELVPGANVTIDLTYDSLNNIYTSTLTLSNLAAADDGQYYCAIGNSGGTTNSASAKLIVKRMIAHWPFDTDPNDAEGSYDGVASGSPVYNAGKVGNAIVLDGSDDFITLPAGFDDFTAGMSISVWTNPSTVTNWGRFVDFGNGAGGVNILFARNGTSNTLRFDTNIGTVDAANAFTQNEWQMFVVTMTEAGAVTIYKNGLPIQTGTVTVPAVVTRTLNYIGESNWTADSLYAGMMDDMRIYNFAITADQIADMYVAVDGTYCRNRPSYDLTGDCLVTTEDLMYLVDYWLDCGFYPDCQ